jgi:RNA polymerase sigma factor (sigma-70 family)
MRGASRLLRLAPDERLVALTRRGQQVAFEALVARYQSRLLAFCRHMLGSREDAEDVLQEVFAAAFNAILSDSRELNVRPWLYRIARNRCLNHLRRRTAIGVDSMDTHFAEAGISTADKVFRRVDFNLLVSDIGGLPETQRSALLLREIDALSYEQIAEALETTVPSVKSLLVRARIGLAEAAEARKLSCDDVRTELAAIAEGISSLTAPVRRHIKECDRCRGFRSHLRSNNRKLAALAPFGPMLLLKSLFAGKLGASAGGASAGAGGAGATAGGGAALAGSSGAGAFTATAIATKAVAGLAAAALITAGAVAVHHVSVQMPPAVTQSASPTPIATTAKVRHLGAAGRHHQLAASPTIAAPTVAPALATAPATSEEVTTTTVFPGGSVTGPTGPINGATGSTGAGGQVGGSAPTGNSGISGTSGISGISGTSGTSGTSGISGSSGISGGTGASAGATASVGATGGTTG